MSGAENAPVPPPFTLSQYVLKVHSRCDLACDHCYVYEHADQTWRSRPRTMTMDTVRAAAARIAEHAGAHQLPRVSVILHGGEPLLLGPDRLDATFAELRATVGPTTRLDLRLQSNGVLLSAEICDLLVEHRVKVGVSLDGDRRANDRHRRFSHGGSSHSAVLRALALLREPRYRQLYAGILCTIDIDNDPIRVYEALLAERPPHVDLLLPHATWERPPHRPPDDPTPYARWLGRIHTRWLADGRPVPIRLFDSLHATAAGGPSGTEAVGLDPADLAVIETDGAWEQADSLKTTYHGAAGTGLDVFSHPADAVARHPALALRRGGRDNLCRTCRACPVVARCGGGLFAHRYRGGGFANPSVYCADLKELITSMGRPPVPVVPVVPPAVVGSHDDARPATLLDEIGAGSGDTATIRRLAESQLAITRALLVAVRDAVPAGGAVTTIATNGWELLGRLDAEAPGAVATVLEHPFVRSWAVGCLSTTGGARVGPEAANLACLAAAAAIRAGVSAEIVVPVSEGTVHLPTLGRILLDRHAGGTAVLATGPRGFMVRTGAGPGAGGRVVRPDGPRAVAGWQPTRRIECDGLTVRLEDTDPYRGCYGWPPATRLTPAALRRWRRSVAAAWRAIGRDVPGQVPGVRAAVRSLVPLDADPTGDRRSASVRDAFGAVAVAGTAPEALAVLIVAESQSVKLGAVLDLYDLVDRERRSRLRVPWRPDPRPVEAALRRTYAHLGVADVWRARSGDSRRNARLAAAHYRRYRAWTASTVDALLATGALTPDGERFVGRMGETVESWPAEGSGPS